MSQFRRKLLESYATNKLVYPGLIAAWSAKGKTNEDADRNVLKDLTGNGHDITLNNFAYSGMSGYGGYNIPIFDTGYGWSSNLPDENKQKYKIVVPPIRGGGFIWIKNQTKFPKIIIKVEGIKSDTTFIIGRIDSMTEVLQITSDGIYIFEEQVWDTPDTIGFRTDPNNTSESSEFTFEILPEYPDALVFDGVDDYGVNESLPSLTDYTVISKIHWITSPNASVYAYGKAKEGIAASVIFSSYSSIGRGICYLYNFGLDNTDRNVKSYVNPVINYHNTKVFNGTPINKGFAVDDNFPFYLGRIWKSHGGSCNMAFYSFYLFNRTLTDEEIKSFIRKHIDPEYLLPSEIPNPDCYYDFSQGSNDDENRNTIVDQSGNGNNAVAYGFAWSGMSGYGGYNLPIEKFIINGTYNGVTRVYGYEIPNNTTLSKLRFNVSGLNGNNFAIRINGLDYNYSYNTDGYYEIDAITNNSGETKTFEIIASPFTYDNVTIDFIPEYEGALVFDGVDDYISLDAFDSGFKTTFMVCISLEAYVSSILYDQRSESFNKNYSIAYYPKSIAYNNNNINGTYINGTLNTKLTCQELTNKKHLIHVVAKDISESRKPNIGRSLRRNQYFNMTLYKFLGFKEALTEEQIKAVINKYNLLDGVDNIN